MDKTFLSIESLKKFWRHGSKLAIDVSQLTINKGERIAIVGPSGSGKSTLLKLLAKDLRPNQGAIYFHGKDLSKWSARELSQHRAVLPQCVAMNLELPVNLIVSLGRVSSIDQTQKNVITLECLRLSNASHLTHVSYQVLSGGERARVQMARVFAQLWDVKDGLLLLDEPFAALDPYLQIKLLKNLDQFATERGITVMAVLHDVNQALQFFDRGLFIKNGQLLLNASLADISKQAFEELYGNQFLEFKTTAKQRFLIAQ
jgi:iron complex transport system ATP-binding protein